MGSNRERGVVFDIRIPIELVKDLGAWLARSYGLFSVVKLGLFGNFVWQVAGVVGAEDGGTVDGRQLDGGRWGVDSSTLSGKL